MFKIIKDPELALQYQEAGLLWWIGEEHGGPKHYSTYPYPGYSDLDMRIDIADGAVGILLEE